MNVATGMFADLHRDSRSWKQIFLIFRVVKELIRMSVIYAILCVVLSWTGDLFLPVASPITPSWTDCVLKLLTAGQSQAVVNNKRGRIPFDRSELTGDVPIN